MHTGDVLFLSASLVRMTSFSLVLLGLWVLGPLEVAAYRPSPHSHANGRNPNTYVSRPPPLPPTFPASGSFSCNIHAV